MESRDAPTQVIELRERRLPPVMMVLYTVLTFGLLWPMLLLARLLHDPVRIVDDLGLTTRRGKRYLWRDLSDASSVLEHMRTRGSPRRRVSAWRIELAFPGRRIAFDPRLFENGMDALTLIERVVGRSLDRPY